MNDESDPTVHAITDEQLRELLVTVAAASYRSATYRGQFNPARLDDIEQQIVERKTNEWFDQHKEQYISHR